MAETTGIAWCDHTWSPWIGCTKVSPGCDHCYAEALDKRHKYGGAVHWGPGAPRYQTKSWQVPRTLDKRAKLAGARRTIFPSMCDPFDNEVSPALFHAFMRLIAETPHLTWLLLTKRIGNAARMLAGYRAVVWPNIWLGASVVNQAEADRDIPKLLATPAAKRFVSYEPALGPVDFSRFLMRETWENAEDYGQRLDWIIVGGESAQGGTKARPFDLAWARSTVQQCRAAGVACFVKQVGSNAVWGDETSSLGRALREGGYRLKDRAGADPAEWPEDLRVREFPT